MDDRASDLAAQLQLALTTERFGRTATVLASTTSTQDEARRLAAGGCPEGQLVWALEQTQGRGRLDRRWVSAPGAGLWFSVVLRPQLTPDAASFLTLAAGVAVATALAPHTTGPVGLKWPNDVLLDGGKLGGILAEAGTNAGGVAFVVLGVGINLEKPPETLDATSALPAVALNSAGGHSDPAQVLADVLAELERCYAALRGGTEELRRRWLALSDTIGRSVRAEVSGGPVDGVAVDLAPDGALVVRRVDGELAEVRFGDVIHVR